MVKKPGRPPPKPAPEEEEPAEEGGGFRLFGKTIALPKIAVPDFRALGRKILGEKLGGKLFGGGKPSDEDEESEGRDKGGHRDSGRKGKDGGKPDDEDGEDGEGKKKQHKLVQLWSGLDRRKKIVVAGAGGFLFLVVVGAGAWLILARPKAPPVVARPHLEAGERLRSALSPPAGEDPANAKGGKAKGKGKSDAKDGGLNALVSPQGAGGMLVVPVVNQDAFAKLPNRAPDPPLIPAPDTALVEKASDGFLPKVGRDGRRPWQVYARPGPAADDPRPRIAIIIERLGPNRAGGIETIRRLPGAVSLAFDPAAQGIPDWVSRARQVGHEVLFMLPARPANFPLSDEGPLAVQAAATPEDNVKRMETVMLRGGGYIGLMLTPGADIVTNETALRALLQAMHHRGLMVVDGGGTPNTLVPRVAAALGQPAAMVDLEIDAEPARAAIDSRLAELETLARNGKAAVGLAHALPVTLERLLAWIPTLEGKGIVLAPVSATAGRQVR